MIATYNELDDVLDQLAIHLVAMISASIFCILLDSPDCPQGYVGLLNLVNLDAQRFFFHKFAQALLGGLHHQLEVVLLANGQRQTRQCNKGIAGTGLEPRITCQQIAVVFLVNLLHSAATTMVTEMELMGSSDQTMIEIVAGHAVGNLLVEDLLQRRRLNGRRRGSKDNALTFLDRHLEIAWNVEVLIRGIAALLLLRIFHATIPVGMENKLILLRELHEEVGVACIHTGLDAIFHLMIFAGSR